MLLQEKLKNFNWLLLLVVCGLAGIGFITLISAANGSIKPWAWRQAVRFLIGLGIMLFAAFTDIRIWMRYAYYMYFSVLILLLVVETSGIIGMGARRWIGFGFIQIQPSELMKVTLVLTLARYFHASTKEEFSKLTYLFVPILIVLVPVGLVLKQPDLGTAIMLLMIGGTLFFLSGVQIWQLGIILSCGISVAPIAWQFMRDYQRKRILTFLNPEADPLGAGYHILQSKIALGSGGLFGKGFGKGTQSHLDFLPEKQTDFIFTTWAEECGLLGSILVLSMYATVVAIGYIISTRSCSYFGRLLGVGLSSTLFLYVFINTAMVMGLIPVVGVPLPLMSYGGTAMLTIMFSFGLILSVDIHRSVQVSRRGF